MTQMTGGRAAVWAVLSLALLGMKAPSPPGDGVPNVLYFFTTPEAEGGPEGATCAKEFVRRHSRSIRLRPVLLARDFTLLRSVSEKSPVFRTIKALEAGEKPGSLNIPLYDEEGLRLAETWDVRTVPAFVLVRNGRAHRMAGSRPNLDLLWECSR
jgi:hypothetical protein